MKAMFMKSKINYLLFFSVLLIVTGCQVDSAHKESLSVAATDVSEEYHALANMEADDMALSIKAESGAQKVLQDLKIIKSANVRYKVASVEEATKAIKQMAEKYQAYISDLRFENTLYKKENRFTVKIPQEHFDAMMDSLATVVEFVEYENMTTKDVTEEYVDIQTRLNTKREVQARYETVLRKKAHTVEDILATEEKLRVLQEEIESAQGRLKYLTNKVSFSTIQIDLYEVVNYTEAPESYSKTFFAKAKDGLHNGWDVVEAIVIGLLNIWPLVLIGLLVVLVIKRRVSTKAS